MKPLLEEFDPNQVVITGGGEQQAPQIPTENLPQGDWQDAIAEPLQAMGGDLIGMILGGYDGILELIESGDTDKAANAVREMKAKMSKMAAPKTQNGAAGYKAMTDAYGYVDKNVIKPVAGAAFGGAMAARNMDTDEFQKGYDEVQKGGLGNAMGDRVLERTGNLFLSELARNIIPLGEATAPLAALGKFKGGPLNPDLGQFAGKVHDSTKRAGDTLNSMVDKFSPYDHDTTAKQRMAEMLLRERIPPEAVGKDLVPVPVYSNPTSLQRELTAQQGTGRRRIVDNPLELEALKQGFDRGVLGSIKNASRATKDRMLKMINMRKTIGSDKELAQSMRHSSVIGESLFDRINKVREVNKSSGAQVGAEAKNLKGQYIDSSYAPVLQNFADTLDGLGIGVKPNAKGELHLDFKGSDVQGLSGVEGSLRKVFNRIRDIGKADAHDLHKVKQYIDQVVTYGKNKSGLGGSGERALKGLRSDLSDILNQNFPKYAKANKSYSESIDALDSIRSLSPKIDFDAPSANNTLGNQLRKLTSNYGISGPMLDAIRLVDDVAVKHGGKYKDNILALNMLSDEIDRVFGTTKSNSMKGIAQEGADMAKNGGLVSTIIDKTAKAVDAKRVNKEKAYAAIIELLTKGSN